ncbi:MAG: LysR family transcriptional regulator [Lachnospiraceae bacterium]
MEVRHIRYFLAVAEELNFTRAAEKLCIAQPPLSRQIQDLEAELGAKLFIRNPHALQLTEEGILFKQYATQILDLVTRSAEDIREVKNGLHGTLYLASVEGHGPRLFSEWIAGFNRLYPHIQYNLWNGNSDDVINRVMKGLCELAIIMEPHNAEGIDSLTVYEEPWIAMIPHDHPLALKEGETIDIDELIPYDLIIPSRASRLEEINGWFSYTGKSPVIRCRIAHMLNAYELVRQQVGIAIYPASAADIADPDICIKTIARPSVKASYVLIWNKKHHLSHVAQEFITYVKSTLK